MKDKYDYQSIAADKVLENLYSGKFIASGLFSIPGSGKTTMSFHILNKYLYEHPKAQVVVLTHGQNTLKLQYLEDLKNPNIPIDFTFGTFDDKAQVLVGLPQSLKKIINIPKIDLLVIDEAHEYYGAAMVQNFISNRNIKNIILLTGSPSQFNLHNQINVSKYGTHYIAGSDLQDLGVFSEVDMDLVVTSSVSIREQLKLAFNKLDDKKADRSKVMIAVKSINDANNANIYLKAIGRKVSLSTSENDSDNEELDKFKSGVTNTLIVVKKGILGFSDNMITALIDLRESQDVEINFQLMARILRVHPKITPKTYLKLSKKNNDGVIMLEKMLALMSRDIYTKYNGKNLTVEIL